MLALAGTLGVVGSVVGSVVGCVAPRPLASPSTARSTIPSPDAAAAVTVHGPADDVARIARSLPRACGRLATAGLALDGPLSVRVHDDVDAFVAATGQLRDTLRAWSTIDGVDLLALSSWHASDDEAVVRRLTHELCHVALFRRTRGRRAPPRPIAEGLCSVVAGQQDERLPLDEVRRRVAAGEGVDFGDDSVFAYGLSHHVVAGIWRCRGGAALLMAIEAMADGVDVDTALGAAPRSFLDDECPGSTAPPDALHSPP